MQSFKEFKQALSRATGTGGGEVIPGLLPLDSFSAANGPYLSGIDPSEFQCDAYQYDPPDANLIADRCATIGHMRDTRGADQSEPLWRDCLGILGHTERGTDVAREWSSGHPGYNDDEFQVKLQGRLRYPPTTCAQIRQNSPHCEGCKETCKSPIALGYVRGDEAETEVDTPRVPSRASLAISENEMAAAELAPLCIVKSYLYADVAQLVAPGGMGKTTLVLHEAVCIALGRPVWGLEVKNPGWTLIVSAEDQRSRLVARLGEIIKSLGLTAQERATVLNSVCIWDVTGQTLRLITLHDKVITLTTLADEIVNAFAHEPPRVVIFDPLISFGVSESLVNDNEQGLITAARRIVNGLRCCVRFVHHSGKANAREKTTDQYTGRGGSALADGSRMTAVLQPWIPEDKRRPPPGIVPSQGSSISILARPKVSYAPPQLPLIWIQRVGFAYHCAVDTPVSPAALRDEQAERVRKFLEDEISAGQHHTRNTLDAASKDLGLTRTELRAALARLESSMQVIEDDLPPELRRGARKTYLRPVSTAVNVAEDDGEVES